MCCKKSGSVGGLTEAVPDVPGFFGVGSFDFSHDFFFSVGFTMCFFG